MSVHLLFCIYVRRDNLWQICGYAEQERSPWRRTKYMGLIWAQLVGWRIVSLKLSKFMLLLLVCHRHNLALTVWLAVYCKHDHNPDIMYHSQHNFTTINAALVVLLNTLSRTSLTQNSSLRLTNRKELRCNVPHKFSTTCTKCYSSFYYFLTCPRMFVDL